MFACYVIVHKFLWNIEMREMFVFYRRKKIYKDINIMLKVMILIL